MVPFRLVVVPALLLVGLAAPLAAWRSELYPESWTPPGPNSSFDDKIMQDFSYAGYARGERAVPRVEGPVFSVVARGADPTGVQDSTDAIQAAITAAEAAGGGVVEFPAGTFRISSRGTQALLISRSGVVLRGAGPEATLLWNTSTVLRSAAVVRVRPPSVTETTPILLTADILGPDTVLPVQDASGFAVGDHVIVRWDMTNAWIADHNQTAYWSEGSAPVSPTSMREVVEVDPAKRWIRVDIPLRYAAKVRDRARVSKLSGMLVGVGMEDFAIANTPHPGSGFGENDYNVVGTVGYDVHNSYFLHIDRVRDSWLTRIHTRAAPGFEGGPHLVSNGLVVLRSNRVTLRGLDLQRVQYGGGGGNGYLYIMQQSSDCLIEDSRASYSRHGMVVNHSGAHGNVWLRCEDRFTQWSYGPIGGSGYLRTSGAGSDHHQHFSHSNLYDHCVAIDSFFQASHRGTNGSVPPHALTAAHTVYWNIRGEGTLSRSVVESRQARYGYVIGTSGARTSVATSLSSTHFATTAPEDHVEGVGTGADLDPVSLYLDQVARRFGFRIAASARAETLVLPESTIRLQASATDLSGAPLPGASIVWQRDDAAGAPAGTWGTPDASGTPFTVSRPGTYRFVARVSHDGRERTARVAVVVKAPAPIQDEIIAEADGFVRGGTGNSTVAFGGPDLLVKQVTDVSFQRRAFLRFDLGGAATTSPKSTLLRLVVSGPHGGTRARVRPVSNDTWGEATLTWDNAPPTASGTIDFDLPELGGVVELDVTAWAASPTLGGDGKLSMRLEVLTQVNGGDIPALASREHPEASWRPRLLLREASHDFAGWWDSHATVPPADRGVGNDPDRDGVPNLLEALLGTDPARADSPRLPAARLEGDAWVMEFTRSAAGPMSLFYRLEQSSSPGAGATWSPVTDLSATLVGRTPAGETWRLTAPVTSTAGARFLRLVVSE